MEIDSGARQVKIKTSLQVLKKNGVKIPFPRKRNGVEALGETEELRSAEGTVSDELETSCCRNKDTTQRLMGYIERTQKLVSKR